MKYLVDANVLSEPTKADPHAGVVEWLRVNEREIAVDAIVLGEVRFGILLLAKGVVLVSMSGVSKEGRLSRREYRAHDWARTGSSGLGASVAPDRKRCVSSTRYGAVARCSRHHSITPALP